MEPFEIQAKAAIAAALIVRGAVEVPKVPARDDEEIDNAGLRLREVTDYVYRIITSDLL